MWEIVWKRGLRERYLAIRAAVMEGEEPEGIAILTYA